MDTKRLDNLFRKLNDNFNHNMLVVSHWDCLNLSLRSLQEQVIDQPKLAGHVNSLSILCGQALIHAGTYIEESIEIINQLAELLDEKPINPPKGVLH